jgi:hypothetical protein
VDLNAEAIQICQLSLWIKTAARGKQLTSLDHTIREGNSVISDPAVHPKAFNCQATFPEVFAQGGFDVVVGNPPYIRQKLRAPFKPCWERRFKAYHGVADIFVYFFEQGVEFLRQEGRLAFITSGGWVRGNFGAPLRRFLSADAKMESMVDFGEYQPFEDVEMIRPSITVLSKDKPGGEMRLFKWLTSGRPPEALSDEVTKAPTVQSSRLREDAWELEQDEVLQLRRKLVASQHLRLGIYVNGAVLAHTCGTLGQERYHGQVNFHRRLFQASSGGHPGPLNQKAEAWWDHSLNQLGDALKQSFKLPTSPMKNPRVVDEWEPYLQEKQKENARLTRALADAEADLNDRVYRLFNLTADDVRLLQKEVEH